MSAIEEPAIAALEVDAASATPRLAATALVAFSACCFGSIPVLTTIATGAGAPLVSVLAWRYAIGALLLVLAAGGVGALKAPPRFALATLALTGGGQAAIAVVSLSALRFVPAATLTFLFYTYPAWVAVIGAVRGTDPLTPRSAIALSLSLVGILVMVGNPWAGGLHPLGVFLALSSAALYAAYIPTIDHVQRRLPSAVAAAYAAGGAAVILMVAGAAMGTLRVAMAVPAWLAIATMGVVSTTLAFIAFLRGLRTLGPVRAAIVSTVEPFWSALLASVALAQPLGPRTVAGGACIAAAVVLLQLRRGSL